jgi:hypothetical protein
MTRDEVCRQAGGRRRYNAARKRAKQDRRTQILCRVRWQDMRRWGIQAALARALGVSRATICRDFRAIWNADRGALLV